MNVTGTRAMDSGGLGTARSQAGAFRHGAALAEARTEAVAAIAGMVGLSDARSLAAGLGNATPETLLASGWAAVIWQASAWHKENAQRGLHHPPPPPRLRALPMERLVNGLACMGGGGTDIRCLGLAALVLLSGWDGACGQRLRLPGDTPPCEKDAVAGLFRLAMGCDMPVDGEAALHDVLAGLDDIPDAGARIRRRLGEPTLAALTGLDDTDFDGMAALLLSRAWGWNPGWRLGDRLFRGLTNGLPRLRQLGVLAGGINGGMARPRLVPAQGNDPRLPMAANQALAILEACTEWLEVRGRVPASEAHGGVAGHPLYRFPCPCVDGGVIRGAGVLVGVLAKALREDRGSDRHSDRVRRLAGWLSAFSDDPIRDVLATPLLAAGNEAALRGAVAVRGQRRRG